MTQIWNGFNPDFTDKLVKQHLRKIARSNLSILISQNETQNPRCVLMRFAPEITNKLKSKSREHVCYSYEIVYRNECKLINILGSTTDKTPMLNKSGIYEIECGKCERNYYGQTRRSIDTRIKDHKTYVRLNEPNKSAMASHIIFACNENIDIEKVK